MSLSWRYLLARTSLCLSLALSQNSAWLHSFPSTTTKTTRRTFGTKMPTLFTRIPALLHDPGHGLAGDDRDAIRFFHNDGIHQDDLEVYAVNRCEFPRRALLRQILGLPTTITLLSALTCSIPATAVGAPLLTETLASDSAAAALRQAAASTGLTGPTDVFFPPSFQGLWCMQRQVLIPSSAEPNATSTFLLTYPFRFVQSPTQAPWVVADRGYNQAQLELALCNQFKASATTSTDEVATPAFRIVNVAWSVNNPNDLRLDFSDGTRKEIKVTKRSTQYSSETDSSPDAISSSVLGWSAYSSEFQRVTLDRPSPMAGTPMESRQNPNMMISEISARRVLTKWKLASTTNARSNVTAFEFDSTLRNADNGEALEGLEIVYDVSPQVTMIPDGRSDAGRILSKSFLVLTRSPGR